MGSYRLISQVQGQAKQIGPRQTRDLGRFQHKRRITIALVLTVLAILLLFIRPAWRNQAIGQYIEILGIGLIALAILGRAWCTLYIGGRKSAEIVRTGPYSMTRNPLYVFSMLGALGVGAQLGSLIIALGFGLLCYVTFSVVVRVEESFLRDKFGMRFQDYCSAVPRFWPRFSRFRDEETLTIKPDRLYRTLMDGLVFFAAYPAARLIEYLQNENLLPVVLTLY